MIYLIAAAKLAVSVVAGRHNHIARAEYDYRVICSGAYVCYVCEVVDVAEGVHRKEVVYLFKTLFLLAFRVCLNSGKRSYRYILIGNITRLILTCRAICIGTPAKERTV